MSEGLPEEIVIEVIEQRCRRTDAILKDMLFRRLEEEYGDVDPRILDRLLRRAWFRRLSAN